MTNLFFCSLQTMLQSNQCAEELVWKCWPISLFLGHVVHRNGILRLKHRLHAFILVFHAVVTYWATSLSYTVTKLYTAIQLLSFVHRNSTMHASVHRKLAITPNAHCSTSETTYNHQQETHQGQYSDNKLQLRGVPQLMRTLKKYLRKCTVALAVECTLHYYY